MVLLNRLNFFTRYLIFCYCFSAYALKTSVIIPCYYNHAQFLHNLISLYEQQTKKPFEVVVSLSELNKIPKDIYQKLQDSKWSFPVRFVTTNQKLYAGQNRNKACAMAKGDIFLTQDADDIPHYQQIEIIEYFFEKYNLDHLMFCYDYEPINETYRLDTIQHYFWTNNPGLQLTNGNIAMSRYVFDKVQWTTHARAQDLYFNRKVHKRFKRCMVIDAILLTYREQYSSTILKKTLMRSIEKLFCSFLTD